MAQITWRDVAAPNFNSAADGFSQFSRILGDSLGGLKSAVGGFDGAKSELVNNQLALALAQMPDAAKAQEAIAAGQVGGLNLRDPNVVRRLNADSLKSIAPGSMTDLGTKQLSLATGTKDFDQRSSRDAQAALFAKADLLARSDKPAEAEALRAGADYSNFGYGAVGALNSSVQDTDRNAISNDSAGFTRDVMKTDYADQTAAIDTANQILEGAISADDARLLFTDPNGITKGLSPRARAAAQGKLEARFPGIFGSSSVGGGGAEAAIAGAVGAGGPVAAGSPWSTVFGNGKYGSADVANMKMGDVVKFGEDVLIPRTKAAGFGKTTDGRIVGTSAAGAFQITKSTLEDYAPRLFGAGWRDMQFSPEQQETIAKAIFEDSKNGNLKARWEGLPDATPGAYKNLSWEQVKPLIFKHELGKTPADMLRDGVDTNVGVAMRGMQDSDGLDADLGVTMNDRSSPAQIADRLIGTGGKDGAPGPLRGTSRAFVLDKLNDVMREANVNAATAGAIIERSIVGSDEDNPVSKLIRRVTLGSPNLGGDARLDDRALKERINRLKTTGIRGEVAASNARNETAGQVQKASAAVAKAQSDLATARTRAVTQPQLAPMVARYEAALAAAMLQLKSVSDRASSTTFQPSADRPAPRPQPVRRDGGDVMGRLFKKYTDGVNTQ